MRQAMEGGHLSRERGATLLSIARQAVLEAVAGEIFEPLNASPWLKRQGATFVTLRCEGELRGCVGSLEACRPLLEDLRENACSAALRDPRHPPLSVIELEELEVEVAVLTELESVPCENEEQLLEGIRPGVDGIVLEYGDQRGTFLPKVWETFPEPRGFLGGLKAKIGLEDDFWHQDLRVWRYTVASWCQSDMAS